MLGVLVLAAIVASAEAVSPGGSGQHGHLGWGGAWDGDAEQLQLNSAAPADAAEASCLPPGKYIFFHVMKTGGLAIDSLLNCSCTVGSSHCAIKHYEGGFNMQGDPACNDAPTVLTTHEYAGALDARSRLEAEAVSWADASNLTILRDPVDRAWSYYACAHHERRPTFYLLRSAPPWRCLASRVTFDGLALPRPLSPPLLPSCRRYGRMKGYKPFHEKPLAWFLERPDVTPTKLRSEIDSEIGREMGLEEGGSTDLHGGANVTSPGAVGSDDTRRKGADGARKGTVQGEFGIHHSEFFNHMTRAFGSPAPAIDAGSGEVVGFACGGPAFGQPKCQDPHPEWGQPSEWTAEQRGELEKEWLKQALLRIRTMSYIGFHEELPAFQETLSRVWPEVVHSGGECALGSVNPTAYRQVGLEEEPDAATRALIERANALDIYLYNEAMQVMQASRTRSKR